MHCLITLPHHAHNHPTASIDHGHGGYEHAGGADLNHSVELGGAVDSESDESGHNKFGGDGSGVADPAAAAAMTVATTAAQARGGVDTHEHLAPEKEHEQQK